MVCAATCYSVQSVLLKVRKEGVGKPRGEAGHFTHRGVPENEEAVGVQGHGAVPRQHARDPDHGAAVPLQDEHRRVRLRVEIPAHHGVVVPAENEETARG